MLCTQATLVTRVLQISYQLTLKLLGKWPDISSIVLLLGILFSSLPGNCSQHSLFSGGINFNLVCRYRVFLGHKQYFVSSDVGAGKMQWYAFHKEPPGGVDSPHGMRCIIVGPLCHADG